MEKLAEGLLCVFDDVYNPLHLMFVNLLFYSYASYQ